MTTITWTPHKNTERQAIRRFGDVWWLVRREGASRLLISSTPDWVTGDLRWIFDSQVVEG